MARKDWEYWRSRDVGEQFRAGCQGFSRKDGDLRAEINPSPPGLYDKNGLTYWEGRVWRGTDQLGPVFNCTTHTACMDEVDAYINKVAA